MSAVAILLNASGPAKAIADVSSLMVEFPLSLNQM